MSRAVPAYDGLSWLNLDRLVERPSCYATFGPGRGHRAQAGNSKSCWGAREESVVTVRGVRSKPQDPYLERRSLVPCDASRTHREL